MFGEFIVDDVKYEPKCEENNSNDLFWSPNGKVLFETELEDESDQGQKEEKLRKKVKDRN